MGTVIPDAAVEAAGAVVRAAVIDQKPEEEMSERDELANLIASVTIDTKSGDVLRVHPDGETPVFDGDQRTADALIAAGYRKMCCPDPLSACSECQ